MPNPPPALRLQFADDMFLRRHDGETSPVVNQVLWRLDGPYDADRLRDLADGIAAGSLHRRVVRARVPGARHCWAPAGTLPVLDLQTAAVAESSVGAWAQAQADLPLDPAHGSSWRLAAADVATQGADAAGSARGGIVSLTCAHAVADGAALIDALVRASTHADPLVVPPPGRGARALLADAADAAAQAGAVARWAGARARQVARERSAVVEPSSLVSTSPTSEPGGASVPAGSARGSADDVGWRAPVLHLELPADRVAQAAAGHGGTPNTWFVAFLARLVHATGRFPGEPVPVALPVSTRGEEDPRANSTKIARVTVPADVLAARDLGWVRAAAKEAYTAVGAEPRVAPVPLELVQMLPDLAVSRLPQPPVAAALASNLGTPPDGFTQAPGGMVRAVATLSHYQGASAAELRAAGGGLVAFCTTAGRTTTLSVAALDPDRVPDAETLRRLVLTETDGWQIPAVSW
ncbi:hypothetical protein APR04_000164 [Promicromonospora umidemergens]|uniref:Condensation domain-containing protein n=1 Tax=Promicromonospora umidemergens TaxID=629679 RepID=A0ABP8X536_9MICO|nr:hypothetical protein [Promicromonospora umidemergens]MCP2281275.1 hypothetical protein [Promicromonospora umidemergens]